MQVECDLNLKICISYSTCLLYIYNIKIDTVKLSLFSFKMIYLSFF